MRVAWGCCLLALAAAVTAASEDLTESAFLAGVTTESAAVRGLGEELAHAEAARRRAGTLANPRIDWWREAPDSDPRVTNLTLAWTPPVDGRRRQHTRASQAGLAAARERLTLEHAGLRQELRAAFAAWSLALERRDALARQEQRVSDLAEQERQRARVGDASGLAARRLALAAAEWSAARAQTEADLALAHARAGAWRPDLAPDARPARLVLVPLLELPESAESPRARALEFDAEQAALDARRASRFVTFPALQVGWQRVTDPGRTRGGPIFGLSWTLPLFDREQAARHEARRLEQITAARAELGRIRDTAEIQGRAAAYRGLLAAWQRAAEAAAEVERVVEAAVAAYRAAEAPLTDLLESLRAAWATQAAEIDLRAQAAQTHRELEAALGHPLAEGGL